MTRPHWALLYTVTLPQLAALGAVEAAHSPHPIRVTLRCLLALGVLATMAVWLRSNRPALDLQNWCDCAGQQMTVRVVESRRSQPTALPRQPSRIPAPVEEEYEVAAR